MVPLSGPLDRYTDTRMRRYFGVVNGLVYMLSNQLFSSSSSSCLRFRFCPFCRPCLSPFVPGQLCAVRLTMEAAQHDACIAWLRDLVYSTEFSRERVSVGARRLLAATAAQVPAPCVWWWWWW